MLASCGLSLMAQTPAAPAPQTPATAARSAPQQIHANLNQLMRGVLYPAANVVFSAQADNPAEAKLPPGVDPSMATDPLVSTFGGWQAIENGALALAESANLLMMPGRSCANGVPAPVKDPAWAALAQELRDLSMKSYAAAQAKSQEKMIELAEPLSRNCSACHRKWRDRKTAENRCK
jgi:hypothetical protein